ncbi:MAG TPA: FAD-dependent oxidoreductase [Bacteroidales bacterium]|nr:FAD-dependent oxidoreductase [Bacteroidales bacterium]
MKILIIGGVAGGASTAARLRRIDEKSEIIMFERGKYISYANCGLPYYIGGIIENRDNLFVQTPESFGTRFNLEVRVMSEVTKINKDKKHIEVKNLETGDIYTESYDKLVLAPGAEPVRPAIPGINEQGIFTLRNVHDTDIIKSYLTEHKVSKAIVVGAGFIGLEMAENLHHLGVKVSIVEMAEQVMTPLDFSMASLVHQHLKTKDVEFYLKDAVNGFVRKDNHLKVSLSSGRVLEADMVVLSIGVRPENKLAVEAGLEIGITKGIVVNEFLQTNDPDIYALGDAIEFENPIIHKKMITYLAGPANKQGRIVADNIVEGNHRKYTGSINTAIAKVFDLTVASTGVSGRTLKQHNINYASSVTHLSSHAGYYPDAMPMSIKIVFEPETGKLFGAQIVGYDGVDKRIDLFATVIKNNGDIYDLQEIEHAYAPPFSSAKDPVNIAGFVAENMIKGKVKMITWRELMRLDQNDVFILDIRTKEEYELGSIENAHHIDLNTLRQNLDKIPKDKKIVVFCAVGQRGYLSSMILSHNGFTEVYNLSGGYKTYEIANEKQSNEDIFDNITIKKDDHLYQYDQKASTEPVPSLSSGKILNVNACGLQCPGPILELKKKMDSIQAGDMIEISASDPGFAKDVNAWANITGNKLISLETKGAKITAVLEKKLPVVDMQANKSTGISDKTIILFSEDLDKALATFVLANGAAATGAKVTIFATFWGLSVLKRKNKPSVNKTFMEKMFGLMLPKNSSALKLSKLHMMGIGRSLIKKTMKSKNIASLEEMIKSATESGVKIIACQMSMDLMGIKKEELIDGVEIGGVATYMEKAEQAGVNLFI